MSDYIISTERLGLRKWMEKDKPHFIAMNSHPQVMQYFPKILTAEESAAVLQRIDAGFVKNNFGLYAVEEKHTGQFIGFTGFSIPAFEHFFTPCVEIGWRYKREVWGRGFATEAAKACLQYGFETLSFPKIVSFTAAINQASEKLMQRIGMSKTGEFNHPAIEPTHILCKHVLYEITNH